MPFSFLEFPLFGKVIAICMYVCNSLGRGAGIMQVDTG